MQPKKRLLLVGWDAADWKLIHPLLDRGELPSIAKLVNYGTSGNLTTLEPQLSPMLWTSIATGKMAYDHGVHGFTEVDPASGYVVPVSAATRECKTIWQILSERDIKSHVVSWFATHGEQNLNGCMVSNMFSHLKGIKKNQDPATWPKTLPGTYWPEELSEKLDEFRVSPFEIDPNTVLRLFVPDAPQIDQTRDSRLWTLLEHLAESYSVQSAATWLMEAEPDWEFMAVYFRSLDEIKHHFMHYHPPKMAGIPERDFELYKQVVTSAYKAYDMMLQRLIALAGDDATVMLVSDHGFHSDHLRPKFTPRVPSGITVWHRPQGVMAIQGPEIKQDELLYGARLLDVTPTILHHFGLPVGEDMEGRVLIEAFSESRPIQTIPSWENSANDKTPRIQLSKIDRKALLDQFIALGYIDEIPDDPTEAAISTLRENKWNLARAYTYGGRLEQALPLLEDCYSEHPERQDFALALARCQMRLGLLEESAETIEDILDSFGRNESAHLLRANIAIERGAHKEALHHLDIVKEKAPEEIQLLAPLGRTYLALRRWDEAESVARKVLEISPNNAESRLGLARIHLHRNESQTAVDLCLEAIGLNYASPIGHFLLGASLAQMGSWSEAETALRNTLKSSPAHAGAHRILSRVLRMQGKENLAADQETLFHLNRRQSKTAIATRNKRLRIEVTQRAEQRRETRRLKREEDAKKAAEEAAAEPMEFLLVSGLPRSGTSLMMQMLRAAGVPLMSDGKRKADEDNPEGYWEWEEIKKMPKNSRIIEQAEGKAVKVISALLPYLPPKHRYKIIFMRRPETEVVRSQWKMLEHHNIEPISEEQHLIETQASHVEQVLTQLRKSQRAEVLEINFPSLASNPEKWIEKIANFVGPDRLPNPEKMSDIVKPDLYRNREYKTKTD